MMTDLKNSLLGAARLLPKAYESYAIEELADGYVKATEEGDECGRDMYYSALVLRFWYRIDRLYRANRNILSDHAEAYEWLVDGIDLALRYKGWQDPKRHLNAQQCIQRAINTIRLRRYYDANLDKSKVNYDANRMSLDAKMSDDGDDAWVDSLADPVDEYAKIDAEMQADRAIQSCIDDKKIVQAIIMDTIAHNDCEKTVKETCKIVDAETGEERRCVAVRREFWPYRLVRLLEALPENYADYFSDRYSVKAEELNAAIESVRKSSGQKLHKFVDRTLDDLRGAIGAEAR